MKKRKKNKNKLLITIFFVIILLVVIGYLIIKQKKDDKDLLEQTQNEGIEQYVQILEDGTKENISTKLKETKKIEDLEVNNIKLTYARGQSIILANVVNTSNKESIAMKVKITLLDSKGNVLTEINGGSIVPLQPGQSTQLNMAITKDCANAYDFTIEKVN